MHYAQKTATLIATVTLATAVVAPSPARSQTATTQTAKPISPSRAENIAHRFELYAGTITVFDRRGRVVKTVGPRGLYAVTILSPDGKRLAVIKINPEQQNRDLWVFDIDTGGATRITMSEQGEGAFSPAWSPDGSQLAYRALRGGSYGFYRKASNGQGPEELLYTFPGSPMLMDWSFDGRFLTVLDSSLGGSTLSVLPLSGERKPIEVVRSPKQLGGGWTSPDSRFIAYNSNESGRTDLYVGTRDPADGRAGSDSWRFTTKVALGASAIDPSDGLGFAASAWRGDGKELYYLGPDQGVMAVAITRSPAFKPAAPKLLFRKPVEEFSGLHVSRDGERFVMIERPSQLRQITIFDRQGKLVKTVGAPGMYDDLAISPDQTRVAVDRIDPKTGNLDIWTFDLANGKGSAVTNDFWPDFNPVWSPDGKRLAYVSVRDGTSGIYEEPSDGTGVEELVFRHTPGTSDIATDWSPALVDTQNRPLMDS
jgi:Tol biopolymer transport system component